MSTDHGTHGSQPAPHGAMAAEELAIVLSHYRLGVIDAIEPLRRGSGSLTKYRIRAETGEYVLKPRAEGRDLMSRVAFSHCVQVELSRQKFPAPALVPTARHRSSIVAYGRRLYELHRWIEGDRFSHQAWQSRAAGSCLAWFHDLLAEFHPPQVEAPSLDRAERLRRVRSALEVIDLRGAARTADLVSALDEAGQRVESLGLGSWPAVITHGDWHPGNVLFGTGAVCAVLDYDQAKRAPRAYDLATAALQFGLLRGGTDPQTWPETIDETATRALLEGYDATVQQRLTTREAEALPWLMIESLIAESVGPIATTGRFAAIDGGAFLEMVGRKVRWLRRHAERLRSMVEAR